MIIDPYNTSFGSLINIKPVEDKIAKFLITNGTNLNYEYAASEDANLVFITGKNDEEQELPLWEHPVVFNDHKGNITVAVDLRKFVKVTNEDFLSLSEVIRDNSGFQFTVLRTLITYEFVSGNLGRFRTVERTIQSSFAYWIADSLSAGIMLTPEEKVKTEVVIMHYINLMMVNGKIGNEEVNTAIIKIANSKLSLPLNIKVIKSIVATLNNSVSSIDDLVANIKIVLGESKAMMLDTNVLVNILATSWFGPGGSETVIIATEDMATWIAMLFVSAESNTYKRTRLATIVNKYKTKVKLKEFVKYMELYVKEQKQ